MSGQQPASELLALPSIRSLTTSDIGVAYQPIVAARTGRLFAYEALVRCRRPEYASPLVLFEQAEKEDACGRLGRMIRDVAFNASPDLPLFVNIHPDELSSRWLVRPDDPIGFHAAGVFLEITEATAFTYFDICMSVLKELCRRTGAKLVVDDFGAGYSNLQRVVDLEPAIVKLDLTLTRDIHKQPRKQAVMRHVVGLCEELGAEVVAEGVESIEELACLRTLGVHYAQGYLLGRPAYPPSIPVWPFDVLRGQPDCQTAQGDVRMSSVPTVPAPFPEPTTSRPGGE